MFKTVKDFLATLTPEERKQHKELIEECLKREKNNSQGFKVMNESLVQLTEILTGIIKDVNTLDKETKDINLILKETNKNIH